MIERMPVAAQVYRSKWEFIASGALCVVYGLTEKANVPAYIQITWFLLGLTMTLIPAMWEVAVRDERDPVVNALADVGLLSSWIFMAFAIPLIQIMWR